MRPCTREDVPAQAPGICYKCRIGGSRDYFVDTGISIDYEGVVYLCSKCLEDIVVASDAFYTREAAEEMLDHNAELAIAGSNIIAAKEGFYAWALDNCLLDLKGLESHYEVYMDGVTKEAKVLNTVAAVIQADSEIKDEDGPVGVSAEPSVKTDGIVGNAISTDSITIGTEPIENPFTGFTLQ